jgi:uncharacterized protein
VYGPYVPRARAPWSTALVVAGLVVIAGCSSGEVADGTATPGTDEDRSTAVDAGEAGHDAPTVPPLHPSVDGFPESLVTIERADGGEPLELAVKLAATPEHRRHGLMEVPDLPDGTGMLFTFDAEHTGGFWMKDTLVPLDIAFVDAGGTIVAILAMDPCEDDPCEVYEPGATYRAALEVPQGWFEQVEVREGDRLDYRPLDGQQ